MALILVIDDAQTVREKLREVLTAAGHKVTEAIDGNDGVLKLTSGQPIDLVISDYNMPGCDGVTMLRKAKEQLGGLKFPVFMLTTETSELLKESGKQVGVVAWVVKPFVAEKLLKGIEKVLAVSKAK